VVIVFVVFYHLLREDMVAVHFSTVLVDLLAIDTGGARAGFKMEGHASKIGELVRAKGAFDVLANVDRGPEVLRTVNERQLRLV